MQIHPQWSGTDACQRQSSSLGKVLRLLTNGVSTKAASTNGVHENIGATRNTMYRNFIQRSLEDYLNKIAKENQIPDIDHNSINRSVTSVEKVSNYDERSETLQQNISKLTPGQRDAYDKAISHISGDKPSQLIIFISGEGGTGKSYLIALIIEYTRLRFGKQRGLYGAAIAMAPVGCAANVISGYTWQSCCCKGRSSDTGKDTISQQTAQKIGQNFRGTKLIVIDEISMINLESIAEMSRRHQEGMITLTDDQDKRDIIKRLPFGGTHVLFTGDLWHLKSIGGYPVYTMTPLQGQAKEGQTVWHIINEYS